MSETIEAAVEAAVEAAARKAVDEFVEQAREAERDAARMARSLIVSEPEGPRWEAREDDVQTLAHAAAMSTVARVLRSNAHRTNFTVRGLLMECVQSSHSGSQGMNLAYQAAQMTTRQAFGRFASYLLVSIADAERDARYEFERESQ